MGYFRKVLVCIPLVVTLVGCGANSPTAPTAPPLANVAGAWTGQLASNNWPAAAISMTLSQSGSTVTGTWASQATSWQGQVSGTVDSSSFTGTVTISSPNALGQADKCQGTASINGAAGGTTIHWTGAGFTGTCTNQPVGLVFSLQR